MIDSIVTFAGIITLIYVFFLTFAYFVGALMKAHSTAREVDDMQPMIAEVIHNVKNLEFKTELLRQELEPIKVRYAKSRNK